MTTEVALELATAGIAAIKSIIDAIEGAKSGSVDPATALAQIQALTTALAKNNAAADAALAAKFPPPAAP